MTHWKGSANNREIATANAAAAARMPCVIEGKSFLSQAQNFISESSSPPVCIGKITIDIRTVRLKRAGTFDAFDQEETPKI